MKKFIQIIKGFFAKPNVMPSFLRAKTKHKKKEQMEQLRDFKTEYEKNIRETKSNILGNKAKIEEFKQSIKSFESEITRHTKANDYLKKLADDYEKKLAELNDPVCHCWSCEFAISKGWLPAQLTEEQNNEVKKYGIEMGLLKLDAVG